MANKEKLPWDMVEEILSRVPPTSLLRFKIVCKRWNTLFNDKTFINNHKKTFRFILTTTSKIYSVSINPKVEVRELNLNIPGLKSHTPKRLVDSNGFLLCGMSKGAAVVWNPWLRQTRYIDPKIKINQTSLKFVGIGYDNSHRRVDEIVFKALSIYKKDLGSLSGSLIIHDLASDENDRILSTSGTQGRPCKIYATKSVSLNGTLYWVAYYDKTQPFLFYIVNFDFSRENLKKFCDIPCGKNHQRDALVLRVFREDRFSLLNQCHVTKKIDIWVTKNKIDNLYGQNVEWMKFMEVLVHNLPSLVETKSFSEPSYFIEDKKLVMCSCDETGQAWIYVVGENKLISKIRLDSVVEPWPLHCTYFPRLVLVPGRQEKKQNYKINSFRLGCFFCL